MDERSEEQEQDGRFERSPVAQSRFPSHATHVGIKPEANLFCAKYMLGFRTIWHTSWTRAVCAIGQST